MKKWFTIIEMLIVSVMASIILTIALQTYFRMVKIKTDVKMKETLIKWTYDIVEKLNIISRNYTIDYEEYFNRRIVGCNWTSNNWDSFQWNVWTDWFCNKFTSYGNANPVLSSPSNNDWQLYYCTDSSQEETPIWSSCDTNSSWWWKSYIKKISGSVGCRQAGEKQSFGEYKLQFWNVHKDPDNINWCANDDDDENLWIWPIAVWDQKNVKELYLISYDNKRRVFLRRKKIETRTFTWWWTWDLYSLQLLKLRWFDIWNKHSLSLIWSWLYDWKIDTWACDYQKGFVCNGSSLGWAYSSYRLPKNSDDWWINWTTKDITITDWNLQIYPSVNPDLSWWSWNSQINPYVKIYIQTKIYPANWSKKINPVLFSWYKMDIQTTLNMSHY